MAGFPAYFWVYVAVLAVCFVLATLSYRRAGQYHPDEQPDKLVIDLNTVSPGQVIDLPDNVDIKHVEFINPLDPQDYVLKKYVTASSAAEAIGMDAQTPVAEVFIADEQVKFQGQTDAVGFHNVHPEGE